MRLSVNQNNDKTRKGGKRGKDGLPPAVLSVPKFVRKSADFDDFQFIGSVGSVDENFFSDLMLQERRAHGGFVGNFVVHRIRFRGARQLVGFVLFECRIP